MASLTYDHVVKRYTADVTVVKDFNVEIQDKEFMVLVGPSGCGKSTALRMLAGLEQISEGQIRIGDRVVNNVAAKDRDISMVFQSYALYPHMSVYDNMAFPLQMQHMKKDEIDKRVKNASRILGLDNFLKRKPRALSGGHRQPDHELRPRHDAERQRQGLGLRGQAAQAGLGGQGHAGLPAGSGHRPHRRGLAVDGDEGRRGRAPRHRSVPLRPGR